MKQQSGLLAGSAIFLFFSIINYLIRFVISVVVARSLGISGKGIYVLLITSAGFLGLFLNLGLSGAFTYLTASGQFKKSELLSFSMLVSIVIGISGGLLFLGIYWFALQHNLLSGTSIGQMVWVTVFIPFTLQAGFTSSILLGGQQILAVNLIEFARNISNLVFQLVSWKLDMGVNGAVGAWLAAGLVATIISLWMIRHDLVFERLRIHKLSLPAFRYGIKSYAANLLTFFNYRLDSLLVNTFIGAGQVGLYSTGVSTAELLWYFPNAVSSALFPKISTLETETAGRITAQTCRQILLLVIIGGLGLAFIGEHLIVLVYGAEFRESYAPLLWLLPGIGGMAVSKIIFAHLSGRGKPQFATWTSLLMLVLTIVGDLILIPTFGIIGAAAASTIAYLSGGILAILWFSLETSIPWHMVILPRLSDLRLLFNRLEVLIRKAGI